MPDSVSPVSSGSETAETTQVSTGQTTQPGGASSTAPANFSSVADLRTKEPALWKLITESLAMKICNNMKHHQDRLKKMMRESTKGA